MRLRLNYNLTMAKVRNCVWVSTSSILPTAHNLFRQFLNVIFDEIFCKLALFLFYGTPAKYIASGNSWWLLWPKFLNWIWLQIQADIQSAEWTESNQLCYMILPYKNNSPGWKDGKSWSHNKWRPKMIFLEIANGFW